MKKPTRPPKREVKPLTAAELEMMNVIWRIGPCTVNQILEQLAPQRELAYTSVSTIVRILEQKGHVSSAKEGRGHVYAAVVPKTDYQQTSLKHLVKGVFDGAPMLLVQRLLDSEALTPEEIGELQSMLRERSEK